MKHLLKTRVLYADEDFGEEFVYYIAKSKEGSAQEICGSRLRDFFDIPLLANRVQLFAYPKPTEHSVTFEIVPPPWDRERLVLKYAGECFFISIDWTMNFLLHRLRHDFKQDEIHIECEYQE